MIEGLRKVTGHGGNPPGQGPFMLVHLVIADGIIREATYETYLCPACHDCGKALCAMVVGKGTKEAEGITRPVLAERVGPLPRAKQICLSLAVLALADAVKSYEEGEGKNGEA